MGILMSQADVCERYLTEFIEQSIRAASFSISTLTLAFHSRFIDRIEAEDSGCAASRSLRIVMTGCLEHPDDGDKEAADEQDGEGS